MLAKIARNLLLIVLLTLVASGTEHFASTKANIRSAENATEITTEKDNGNQHASYELHSTPFSNAFLTGNNHIGLQFSFPSFEKRSSNLHLLNSHMRNAKQTLRAFSYIHFKCQAALQMHGYYLFALCKILI